MGGLEAIPAVIEQVMTTLRQKLINSVYSPFSDIVPVHSFASLLSSILCLPFSPPELFLPCSATRKTLLCVLQSFILK